MNDLKSNLDQNLIFQIELVKLNVAETVVTLMESASLGKSELAKKMNVSPAFITKILSGDNNFTLETMVKVGLALNQKIEVRFAPMVPAKSTFGYFTQQWIRPQRAQFTTNAEKEDHECISVSYAA